MNCLTNEAMILAGGQGTRLRPVISDRPKPMAMVGNRPFITYLLEQLERQGFTRVIICTGHMGECIPHILGERFGVLDLIYSREQTPLGTGGALRHACNLVSENDVLVMNGDSFCEMDLVAFGQVHRSYGAAATLAVLHHDDRKRSGAVTVDEYGRVSGFESRPTMPTSGLINAGVYMLRRRILQELRADTRVSLENDVFPALCRCGELYAWRVNGRFIDIGTPESYSAAQTFFSRENN